MQKIRYQGAGIEFSFINNTDMLLFLNSALLYIYSITTKIKQSGTDEKLIINRSYYITVYSRGDQFEFYVRNQQDKNKFEMKKYFTLRILPIPKSYTFLHRLLTRNPLTSDFWSFLHFPEFQISREQPTDHLSSLNKCTAEFRNSCISGITRKCRNSWSFLHFPEFVHIGNHQEMQEFLVMPALSGIANISQMAH